MQYLIKKETSVIGGKAFRNRKNVWNPKLEIREEKRREVREGRMIARSINLPQTTDREPKDNAKEKGYSNMSEIPCERWPKAKERKT